MGKFVRPFINDNVYKVFLRGATGPTKYIWSTKYDLGRPKFVPNFGGPKIDGAKIFGRPNSFLVDPLLFCSPDFVIWSTKNRILVNKFCTFGPPKIEFVQQILYIWSTKKRFAQQNLLLVKFGEPFLLGGGVTNYQHHVWGDRMHPFGNRGYTSAILE